jgi:threonine/homoserine/homoserine lactone efflux protein
MSAGMVPGEVGAFIVAGFALVGSPGPATLSLAAAGAAFDIRAARIYLFGILAGASLVVIGVAAGLLTAILSVPYAANVLATVSFTYLIYLAYRIATAAPSGSSSGVVAAPGFMTGMVFNLSNPKAYAAFAALFAGFDLMPGVPLYATAVEVLICFAILIVADIVWLYAGSVLRRHLHDPRKSRVINIAFAILLIISVIPALAMFRLIEK